MAMCLIRLRVVHITAWRMARIPIAMDLNLQCHKYIWGPSFIVVYRVASTHTHTHSHRYSV